MADARNAYKAVSAALEVVVSMRPHKLSQGDPAQARLNRSQSEYERERGNMISCRDVELREARDRAAQRRAERALHKARKEKVKGMPLCDTSTGEALV